MSPNKDEYDASEKEKRIEKTETISSIAAGAAIGAVVGTFIGGPVGAAVAGALLGYGLDKKLNDSSD